MKPEKLEGKMDKAYGQDLPKSLTYSGEFQVYENIGEVKSANDMPSDEEVVNFRNTQRRNNARQKFMQEALDTAGIKKPTLETSEELRIKNIVDSLVASGKSAEEATTIAKAALGIA